LQNSVWFDTVAQTKVVRPITVTSSNEKVHFGGLFYWWETCDENMITGDAKCRPWAHLATTASIHAEQ